MANLPEKEKLVRNFNRCANWEEKYLYIIELGAKLPESSESLHQPENVISGCQSQVWIKMHPQSDGTIAFEGDSDAAIVKGLIADRKSVVEGNSGKINGEHGVYRDNKKKQQKQCKYI